jgi:hypothetical protein
LGKEAAGTERRGKYEVKYVRKWMEFENTVQGTVIHKKAEEAMQ